MFIGMKAIQQLFSSTPCILRESEESYCLIGWLALEAAPVPYNTNLLYVCECDKVLTDLDLVPGMQIICLLAGGDESANYLEIFPSFVNVLFVSNSTMEIISSTLEEFFYAQYAIGLFAESMLDILFSEGGIQAMVDHAYNALNNPIFVFDAGFNLIAANWEQAKQANIGLNMIENRGFSDDEFKMANSRNRIHEKVLKSEIPIVAHNDIAGYDQLLCAINTKKDLGHIVVSVVNRPLAPMDNQLLQVLKKSIDQQLKKDEFIRNAKGFNYEYFLKNLLDGKTATGKPFLDRLDYVSREFSGNMYCLVIETARSSELLNTNHVCNLFESRFPNTKTLIYNGEIIAIISVPTGTQLPKESVNDATKICTQNNLYAGLSNYFQSISALPEYYMQALRAIELGVCKVNKPNLFCYEDYYLEHMKNIFVQKESSETFCHPKMKTLLDYDKKHNSKLAYTLYMYLIHERSIAAASSAMHMHRNSLVYRIEKINSLVEHNFDSYRERQYIILSYEMNHDPTTNL